MGNADETLPADSQQPGTTAAAPGTSGPPESIGPYRLIECLGEGGMGTVYKANQTHPIKRTVAIKLIKPGFDSAEVIARFESERQALARMDHPNIAKVLDAGTDERGRPYFVMEYVPGTPIIKYADDNRLSIKQRLELVLQVCDAIGHAHAKAIIHRDIKASNVLAHSTPEGPKVKVIDFGVAKALTSDRLTDRTFNTARGQAIGTYESMSPEQADGSPDIDTRTDVYSLGVLLYELLSGTKPFDKADLARAADAEIKRIIRDVDPPKPSTRLSGMTAAQGSTIATCRRAQFAALTYELRSELEWIPLMAMRKERDRRYASPLALAEDIRNYLADRPLRAGPESVAYRLGKTIRRNRAAILATACMFLVAVCGTAIYIHNIRAEQARTAAALAEARQQRALAEEQRSKAEARFADVRELANDFMFKFDDALVNVSGATPARKMLAATALKYLDRLSRDAAADRSLSRELSFSYKKVGDILGGPNLANVGDTDRALLSYRKAMEIDQALARADPANTRAQRDLSLSYERIGEIQAAKGRTDGAVASCRQAQEIRQKLVQANPDDAQTQRDLSVIYERIGDLQAAKGLTDEALATYRQTLEINQKLARADPANAQAQQELSISDEKLGDIRAVMGQKDQALASYQMYQHIIQKLAQADPANAQVQRDLSVSYDKIGDFLQDMGRKDEALASYRKGQAISQQLAQADPANARAQRDLAGCYERIGNIQAARGEKDDALASYRMCQQIDQKLAQADPGNAVEQLNLATSIGKIGDIQAAKGEADAAVASYLQEQDVIQKLAQADPGNIVSQTDLAVTFGKTGDIQADREQNDEALASYLREQDIFRKLANSDPGNARTKAYLANTDMNVSWCQLVTKDFSGALNSSEEGLKADDKLLPLEANRAHALLLSKRENEARAIYLKYVGKKNETANKPWEASILADFAELEKHGITNPAMAEIRKALLAAKATSRPTVPNSVPSTERSQPHN